MTTFETLLLGWALGATVYALYMVWQEHELDNAWQDFINTDPSDAVKTIVGYIDPQSIKQNNWYYIDQPLEPVCECKCGCVGSERDRQCHCWSKACSCTKLTSEHDQ